MHLQIKKHRSPSRIHNTRQRKRIENEERTQPEAQYQRELEGVQNDVAHLTSMLEQILRAKDGEVTSTQPDEAPPVAQIPVAPINTGANTPNKQHPNPTRPIQIPITMDLTNEDPHDVRFSNHEGYDKWTALVVIHFWVPI
jgi:membrane-associated HD superfamily phosphohydrolase